MSETFDLINRLSDERFNLYRLASKQHLTVEQQNRLSEITNQLPVLWDEHRREMASEQRPLADGRAA